MVLGLETEQQLDDNGSVCQKTRVLVDIVCYGLCFDQLNASSLAVFELACRRLQAVISADTNPSKVNWCTARLMTVASSVDDRCSQRPVGTRNVVRVRNMNCTCGDVRQGLRWDHEKVPMEELTLALTTKQANLHQVVRKAVVLRRGEGNHGIPSPRRPRPKNHDVSGAGVDQTGGSCSATVHRPCSSQVRRFYLAPGPLKTSCPASWMACRRGEKDHLSSGRDLDFLHVQLEACVPWRVILFSLIARIHYNKKWLLAACLWLTPDLTR